ASLQCLQPERDAKAELNHRSQACEILTDTGIRVAKSERGSCVRPPGTALPEFRSGMSSREANGMYLAAPMLGKVKSGIPCWNCTSLCGFASHRLNCSANGISTGKWRDRTEALHAGDRTRTARASPPTARPPHGEG